MKPKLSVALAAKNEAAKLPLCLKALAFAEEVVLVDDASIDDTVKIAEAHGARVIVHDSKGNFHANKNLAISAAVGDWVLSLDADEIIPKALAVEIRSALESARYDAYEIGRRNYFLGQWIRGCGWYPDYTVRLWRKGVSCWPLNIHDTPSIAAPYRLGRLQEDFLHLSYDSFEQYFEKFNRYTTRLAEEESEKGMHLTRFNAPLYLALKPGYWFLRKYLYQQGLRDGLYGLFIASSSAATIAVCYLKLAAKQRGQAFKGPCSPPKY